MSDPAETPGCRERLAAFASHLYSDCGIQAALARAYAEWEGAERDQALEGDLTDILAALQALAAAPPPPAGAQVDRKALDLAMRRLVSGALRSTIKAHGPLTGAYVSSASKRVVGQLLADDGPLAPLLGGAGGDEPE